MLIGEIAKQAGLSASRIRFYETQGLLSASRRANGYRTYDADTLVTLNIITCAQDAGFTLEEIRRLLPGDTSGAHDGGLVGSLRAKLADIRAMEKRLARTRRRLEVLVADIEQRPDGLSCEENADRILKNFEASASQA
jgi:DNA-binding transcriptional MerR regulator